MTLTARPVDKAGVRRPGIVYACDVLDHTTRRIVPMDYVGQSRRKLKQREAEHRDCQPWADLIVGNFYVLARGLWTDDELDAAERDAIRRHRPRLNYKENLDNPDRIPIYVQREQRWERDDAAGKPRWVHPDDRTTPAGEPMPVGLVEPVALWRPWQTAALAWIAVWVAVTSLVWLLLGVVWSGDQDTLAVAAGSFGVAGTAEIARRWYRPRRRRQR